MSQMLIAIRDGVIEDPHLGLFEITAGRTRVAPSALDEQPELEDYFERDFGAPGTDSTRAITRVIGRDGRMHPA